MNNTFILNSDGDDEFDDFLKSKKRKSCESEAMAKGKNKYQAKVECKTKLGGSTLGRTLKKVGLSVPRGAFLLLTRLNYRGIASRTARAEKDQPTEFERAMTKWRRFGGSDKSFLNSVRAGKSKKPLACGKSCKAKFDLGKKSFNGEEEFPLSPDEQAFAEIYPDTLYSNVEPATTSTGTVILTALPVLGTMVGALAGIKMSKTEKESNLISAQAEVLAKEKEKQIAEQKAKGKTRTFVGIGVISVILLGGIFLIVKKRRRNK